MTDKLKETKQKEEKIVHNYIFSKENVNIGRQPEFDYLKTLIILLMLPIHTYENFSRDCFSEIIEFIGIFFGAPGFMMLMGIGMKYTRHQEPSNYISRGILLFTKGLYVNLLKNALPNLIAWWTTEKKKIYFKSIACYTNRYINVCWNLFFVFSINEKNEII